MKIKYATLPLLVTLLSGCNVSSEDIKEIIDDVNEGIEAPSEGSTEPTEPPAAFNLTEITTKDVDTLTFSWSGNSVGTTYKVCLKDVLLPDTCNELTSVTGGNSADVAGLDVFEASISDFFVIAENKLGRTLSSESPIDKAVAASLVQFMKASNAAENEQFGKSVSISNDGKTVAVGSWFDDSSATGVNGNEHDTAASASGAVYVFRLNDDGSWIQEAYIKASNTDESDTFYNVSLSGDGKMLAVGAGGESSSASGINGNQMDNSAASSGAVYAFRYNDDRIWVQEAYIKASNTESSDGFGKSLSLSDNGHTLAVAATGEDSSSTGVNGDESDNSASASGAVYVYQYDDGSWTQEAYVKASNTEFVDKFGSSVALSGDGKTLAVGADGESSSSAGVNGDESDNSSTRSGAAYVYRYDGANWAKEAYIKASNPDVGDGFGGSVSLSTDGNTLAVGADNEDSSSTGVNGSQLDNSTSSSGAVYVYRRNGSNWTQEAYIKSSNPDSSDYFGRSLDISGDGNTLAISAYYEDSSAVGVNGDQLDNSASKAGAVYLYKYDDSDWVQSAYVKASNAEGDDRFGDALSLSSDGSSLAVGAGSESSSSQGVNGDQMDNSASGSGAVYIYK